MASAVVVTGAFAGIIYAGYEALRVKRSVSKPEIPSGAVPDEEEALNPSGRNETPHPEHVSKMVQRVSTDIAVGAKEFLKWENILIGVFIVVFAPLLGVLVGAASGNSGHGFATAMAFIVGALTSMVSGYLGMMIAVAANWRTAIEAHHGHERPFNVAFRGGSVMGFGLTGLGLLILYVLLLVLEGVYDFSTSSGFLFEAAAGYGLGASSIALFARVGGGIYTKAADIGADTVGKVSDPCRTLTSSVPIARLAS